MPFFVTNTQMSTSLNKQQNTHFFKTLSILWLQHRIPTVQSWQKIPPIFLLFTPIFPTSFTDIWFVILDTLITNKCLLCWNCDTISPFWTFPAYIFPNSKDNSQPEKQILKLFLWEHWHRETPQQWPPLLQSYWGVPTPERLHLVKNKRKGLHSYNLALIQGLAIVQGIHYWGLSMYTFLYICIIDSVHRGWQALRWKDRGLQAGRVEARMHHHATRRVSHSTDNHAAINISALTDW